MCYFRNNVSDLFHCKSTYISSMERRTTLRLNWLYLCTCPQRHCMPFWTFHGLSTSRTPLSSLFPQVPPLTYWAVNVPQILSQNRMLRPLLFCVRLVVTATDRGSPRLAGSATLTVIIVDLNDNSPTIPLPREIRIPESKPIFTSIMSLHRTWWLMGWHVTQ